jgi:hypothetical protein
VNRGQDPVRSSARRRASRGGDGGQVRDALRSCAGAVCLPERGEDQRAGDQRGDDAEQQDRGLTAVSR